MKLGMTLMTAPWAIALTMALILAGLAMVFVYTVFLAVEKLLDFDQRKKWRP